MYEGRPQDAGKKIMTPLELRAAVARAARTLKNKVDRLPPYNGEPEYLWVIAKGMRDDKELGLRIVWSRDVGHRKHGLKARELERCFHLAAMDMRDLRSVDGYHGPGPAPAVYALLVETFLGQEGARSWYVASRDTEPSGRADKTAVRHWRLFCDAKWEPIIMRREAEDELRALGWKKASEVDERKEQG